MKIISPQQLDSLKEVRSPELRDWFGKYYRLPNDLQQWMFAEEAAIKIYSTVHEKHELSEDQAHKVAKLVGLIFLGEIPVKDFIRKLVSDVGVGQQKAAEVAKDINQEIFQPVKESLMEVHGIVEKEARDPALEQARYGASKEQETNQPLSLNELESREGKSPTGTGMATDTSREAREVLIEKLKREKGGEKKAAQKAIGDEDKASPEDQEATQVAWNGRTIDLSKIPPRRKSPKNNKVRVVHEA